MWTNLHRAPMVQPTTVAEVADAFADVTTDDGFVVLLFPPPPPTTHRRVWVRPTSQAAESMTVSLSV